MKTFFPVPAECWFLTGPTAAGKSALSLLLAERLDAEIVSVDSMAVYRGMDVGTAKPSDDARAQVHHHLLDVVDVNDEFSVAEYLTLAHEAVEDILARGKQVLFVGGTPLYLKSLLRGLGSGPPADDALRMRLGALAEERGPEQLHSLLQEIDPEAAGRLHPHDTRRLIRALEVHELTGEPISSFQQQFAAPPTVEHRLVLVIDRPRPELHERINRRVAEMFERGIVAEVRGLLRRWEKLSQTAEQAVGYREVIEHLAGRFELEEAMDQTRTRSRRLARRQLTWFRSLPECRWSSVEGEPDWAEVVGLIINEGSDGVLE